jgi:hypothetical protein
MSDDDRPTPAARAQRLIDEGINLTLATVGASGAPWVSPVFYVPDANYDLFWTSEKTARHSENIRASGVAAIVIVEADPDKRVDAVYMSAVASELTEAEEIEHGITVMLSKPQPERWTISSPGDVSADGPWRIYRARPTQIDVRATETEAGKPVARREAAEFRLLPGA